MGSELNLPPVRDLSRILRDLVETHVTALVAQGQKIRFQAPEVLAARVPPGVFETLTVGLLSDALARGRAVETVWVELSAEGDQVTLELREDGEAPGDDLDRRGLGMARHLTTLHKGELSAEVDAERGHVVRIQLQVERGDERGDEPDAAPPPTVAPDGEAAAELAAVREEYKEFVYVASHDLQEPVRTISSYVQLLERRCSDQMDERADKFLHYIVDAASRLQGMIQDLLAFSRAGRVEPKVQEVSLDRALSVARSRCEDEFVEAEATLQGEDLGEVQADAEVLAKVLTHLLSNAIKFRRDEPPVVQVAVRREDARDVISVQDNGMGIEAKSFETVFKIFGRLHGVGKYPGSGSGLAIVKRLVAALGGEVWLESTPGEGSTFFVALPRR